MFREVLHTLQFFVVDFDFSTCSGLEGMHDATSGKCYLYNSTALVWDDAARACERNGGLLMVIHNRDVHRNIKSYISK